MYSLFAKKEFSAPFFDYIKAVETEEELDQWIERAVDLYEGIAWLEIQESKPVNYCTFTYDKLNRTEKSRASYIFVKQGEKIEEITNFYIDDAKKLYIYSPEYAKTHKN